MIQLLLGRSRYPQPASAGVSGATGPGMIPLDAAEDGLVPALQDRGLVRTAYEHTQFRDNLLAF